MPTYSDTFTDTAGTLLTAHTPDSGGSWSIPVNPGTPVISTANRLRANANSATLGIALYSVTPTSADYSVQIALHNFTFLGGRGGPVARWDSAANSGYHLNWSAVSGTLTLFRRNAGTDTSLGTHNPGFGGGTTQPLVLECTGANIVAKVGTTTVINVTDASPILTAGQAGLSWRETSGTPSESTGLHLDSWSATFPDAGATASGAVTLAAAAAAGSGAFTATASAAATLAAAAAAGSAAFATTASGSITLAAAAVAGSGSTSATVTASGSITLAGATAAGAAFFAATAAGDVTLAGLQVSSSATADAPAGTPRTLREAVAHLMKNSGAVAELVGERVYPSAPPQSWDPESGPCLCYVVAAWEKNLTLDGPDGTASARVRLVAYADSLKVAEAVADAAYGEWDDFAGPVGDFVIDSVTWEDQDTDDYVLGEGSDVRVYQVTTDYDVLHRT